MRVATLVDKRLRFSDDRYGSAVPTCSRFAPRSDESKLNVRPGCKCVIAYAKFSFPRPQKVIATLQIAAR
jgi:hypothetical protein